MRALQYRLLSIRQKREKAVVQLYKEGKTYRDIPKIAKISVRDIKPVLLKYGADNLSEYADIGHGYEDAAAILPNSTKAYKLFSEGKTTISESAEIAELSVGEMMELLVDRGIKSKITLKDYEEGLSTAIEGL